MTGNENAVLVVAARWVTPLGALFALTLLANWPAGAGVGFVAGLAISLPIAMNALIFGVRAVLASMPPFMLRAVLTLAVVLAFVGVGLPNFRWSAYLVELGAFMSSASGLSLISLAIMARAGALRDAT